MIPTGGQLESCLAEIEAGRAQCLYLVVGELLLAEPAAERLARALAESWGGEYRTHRRPPRLEPLLDDLQTYALFSSGKITLVVDTNLLADRSVAAELIAEARQVLPLSDPEGTVLDSAVREAACQLLQVFRLFGSDPYDGTEQEAVAQLPSWALSSRRRRLSAAEEERRRSELVTLLAAARRAGVQGLGEGAASRLAEVLENGLPAGHALVLAERSAASDHPLLAQLEERRAVCQVGRLAADRRGSWEGLELVAAELERETGCGITRDALNELARRTLRQERGGGQGQVEPTSSARLAAEYRKLATLCHERIERAVVEEAVEDRGDEDVWKLLDAVGSGRVDEALGRLQRLLAGASDPAAARLAVFALLASFCGQLVSLKGALSLLRVPPGERSYQQFRSDLAPVLTGQLPDDTPNPLQGVHPFRLHRAYLAASGLPLRAAQRLPLRVLETELALKGESGDPDTALVWFVAELAGAVGRPSA